MKKDNLNKGVVRTILSGFDRLYYLKNSALSFWCNNLLLLLIFFKKLIKLKYINRIKDVNKNAKRTFFSPFFKKKNLFSKS